MLGLMNELAIHETSKSLRLCVTFLFVLYEIIMNSNRIWF